jgi:hypothetical protein
MGSTFFERRDGRVFIPKARLLGVPPGCFSERGCKLLKTKEGECEKRAKRL